MPFRIVRSTLRTSIGGLLAVSLSGCIHSPFAQQATNASGSQATDGLSVTVPFSRAAAVDSTVRVLTNLGYAVADRSSQRLRSRARVLGGDTTLVVEAQIIPFDEAKPSSIVTVAATYSIPSLGIRDAQVRHEGNLPSPMWAQLRELETALKALRR